MTPPWGRVRDPRLLIGIGVAGTLIAATIAIWLVGFMPRWTPGGEAGFAPGQPLPAWIAEVGPPAPHANQRPVDVFAAALVHRGQAAPEAVEALCRGAVTRPDSAFRRFRKSVIIEHRPPICSLPERVLARAPLAVALGAGLGGLITIVALAALGLVWGQLMVWLASDLRRWWLFDRAVGT